MGEVGGGESRQSTEFRRAGSSATRQHVNRPGWLNSANQATIEGAKIDPSLLNADMAKLMELLTKDFSALPGAGTLSTVSSMPATGFTGESAIQSIGAINPYSDEYKEQTTDFFNNMFSEAAAAARTGPDAVRGGTAHGAMVESNVLEKAALNKFREITGLQLGQADMTARAVQLLQAIESGRRSEAVGAQTAGAEQIIRGSGIQLGASDELTKRMAVAGQNAANLSDEFGTGVAKTSENLSGRGVQNSSFSQWQAGTTQLCCFIFLEALNGKLPWFVRRARDLMCTPQKVSGYRRMSRWLVPAMRQSRCVTAIVNAIMVKRFLAYGAYYFNAEGASTWKGLLNKPVCVMWFLVWSLLGRKTKSYADI